MSAAAGGGGGGGSDYLKIVHKLQAADDCGTVCVIQDGGAVKQPFHEHLALLQRAVDSVAPHEAVKQTLRPRLCALDVAARMVARRIVTKYQCRKLLRTYDV